MKHMLLLAMLALMGCSGGCAGDKPTPTIKPEVACSLPDFVKTPCGLSARQTCDLMKTCRDDVQASCYIDPAGKPDPGCPALLACDEKVSAACNR